VSISLEMNDGTRRGSSVGLVSQLAVDDPWLGNVTGELPTLELQGQ